MNLDLKNDKQVMVRFKNYGFFVPKDIEGKDVIVEGKAFIDILSIDELKHYAFDAGTVSYTHLTLPTKRIV